MNYMNYNCQDSNILNNGHLKNFRQHTLGEVQGMFQNFLGSLSPRTPYIH